jgi:hypothetical protein
MLRCLVIALAGAALWAGPACDISIESPGGSKAGEAFKFTISSTATPVTVRITISSDPLQTNTTTEKQESISVTIPDTARGKTLEIVAENKDGCLVTWTETVQ